MKKRTAVVTLSLLGAAVAALGILAVSQSRQLRRAKGIGDVCGESALREMASSLSAMSQAMTESAYATDPSLCARLMADAAAGGESALTAMSSLPYATQELEKTARFLNETGDYAAYLARRAARGELPSAEEAQTLASLTGTLDEVAARVGDIGRGLSDGAVQMDCYGEGADACRTDTVGAELRAVEEALPEYPSLRYTGRFAPRVLSGETVTQEAAKRTAARFLGVPEQRLAFEGESGGDLKCFVFGLTDEAGGAERVCVAAAGGAVSQWSEPNRDGTEQLSREDAERAAAGFLREHGYTDLKQAASACQDGVCVVTFAAVQQGVLCLPDAVSVSVSRGSGRVCAFNAEQYLLHHRDRGDLTPAVTAEEAAAALPAGLTLRAERLTVSETSAGEETLCRELRCDASGGRTVTVFVNARTGRQEKITVAAAAET